MKTLLLYGFLTAILAMQACNNCMPLAVIADPPANTVKVGMRELDIEHVGRFVRNNSMDGYYGYYFLGKGPDKFLVYITLEQTLALVHLLDSNRSNILNSILFAGREKRLLIGAFSDTLAVLDREKQVFSYYTLTDSITLQLQESFDLRKYQLSKDIYFMFNFSEPFQFRYPQLLIPYGHLKKPGYIDSTSLLLLDLLSNSARKIAKFPRYFKGCNMRDYNSSTVLTNNAIYCIFNKYDSVYQYSLSNDLLAAGKINHHCELRSFDKSKEQDLAYIRKFSILEESNQQLLADSSNNLYIIKKYRSDSLKSPMRFGFYVFDTHFNQVYSSDLPAGVTATVAFNYGNGFMVFNDSLTKAYTYALEQENNRLAAAAYVPKQ
jgi:hypothetical protein